MTSARYTTQQGTVLTKESLFPFLRLVVEAHGLLGVRLDGRDDSLDVAFLRFPTMDLVRVVKFSTSRMFWESSCRAAPGILRETFHSGIWRGLLTILSY